MVLWKSIDSQLEHLCDKDQEVEKNKILCVGLGRRYESTKPKVWTHDAKSTAVVRSATKGEDTGHDAYFAKTPSSPACSPRPVPQSRSHSDLGAAQTLGRRLLPQRAA
jgi:hypothetical protein